MKFNALDILTLRIRWVCRRGQMKLPGLLLRHVLKLLENVEFQW
ncbi:hypothetical protein CXB51_014028 [Gossypium anomalum]|uniref:Uncharacterized protein n=1 Tax=Gossypium anomalum TaxID=47600 RepID=A0A8J5ZKT6_9ROSI|nr:hypothetical protein CXB51_014028 [Gossypium anomalum]